MKRLIEKYLLDWKQSTSRKPLLLRGARQVGKTWSVCKLGDSFDKFLELNFEQDQAIGEIFSGNLAARRLCERIGAYFGTAVSPGHTLLFLDEVQVCPNALRALRFFYEQMPELHVIAAGSLLEFALAQMPSFGVGRIQSLYMYPMCFREFAMAMGDELLMNFISSTDKEEIDLILHRRAVELLRVFMIVGGFPQIVKGYRTSHDLSACSDSLDDLYVTIRDDFAKYRNRVPAIRLDETFRSSSIQAGGKFVYSHVSAETGSKQAKDALGLLLLAGLVHQVVHTAAQGIPPGAQIKSKLFKIIPCDIGLYHRLSGLSVSSTILGEERALVNAGAAAEVLAGTEILACGNPHRKAQLYYWQKEKRIGNAEVDYVVQIGNDLIPLEVKSGTRGSMQSMRIFLDTHPAPYGIRSSLEMFSEYDRIQVVPLYALDSLSIV